MKKIVIVESPGKIKKIQQYLGPEYIVKASFGHCRDLDSKSLSIDVDNNFEPNYSIIPGKEKVVRNIIVFSVFVLFYLLHDQKFLVYLL